MVNIEKKGQREVRTLCTPFLNTLEINLHNLKYKKHEFNSHAISALIYDMDCNNTRTRV